jgi:parallel beta-helix repeat protein
VNVKDLGFWSGRTGGVALTGTNRPDLGAVASVGKTKLNTSAGTENPNLALTPATPGDAGTGAAGDVGPADPLDPGLDLSIPLMDYVSSQINHSTIDGDAFGLFVTGANGLQITDSTVSNSLFAGIELHRFVTNGVIQRTTSTNNGGDGFNLDRASEGVVISEATATRNAGDGFSLSGRPLSDGPSAVGSPLVSYGNNSVSNSTATSNAHYGIEVNGGFNIGVQNNQINGSDMGIVVTDAATHIAITGNTLSNQSRHGIALVNGVSDASVTGNIVSGADTGIYLRDSSAGVKGNTVEHASLHGITVAGSAKGTSISYNVMAGRGASALDLTRAHGQVSSASNQVNGWHDTTPWFFYFKKLLHPMTILWATIFVLVVLSAIRSRSRRRHGLTVHPYAQQVRRPAPPIVLKPRVVDVRDSESEYGESEYGEPEYAESEYAEASG